MKRRDFITLLAGAMGGWPLSLRAQHRKVMPIIGFLGVTSPGSFAPFIAALHHGLSKTGYVEGQNVAIEYRWAEDHYDRLAALAADLVARKVDVIVTSGGTPPARAASEATSDIPIFFIGVADPVATGLVASFARPGGNLTGVSNMAAALVPKRVEILAELVPRARIIALLMNPHALNTEPMIRDVQEAARERGLQFHVLEASTEEAIDTSFTSLVQLHVDALIVGTDPFFNSRREQLVTLAARHTLPAIYEWREFVTVGGLISYGPSLTEIWRHAGVYVGRILRGVKPADLPVEQPTKFELVINLKAAKELGLTVPQSILAGANDVIE